MFLVNYLTQPKITFPARINYQFESQIARLLDEAGVPNFMWGEPYLGILGSSTAGFGSRWAVPDHLIDKAGEALAKASFPPCKHGREKCPIFDKRSTHPYPDHHFHTDLTYPEAWPDFPICVHLYKKSRLFWEFPDPTLGPPSATDPYYMLVGDPRIRTDNHMVRGGRGPKPADLYPVKMAVPARYTEAMVLLQLRDACGQRTMLHWEVELIYLLDPGQILGLNLDLQDLRPAFRDYLVADNADDSDTGHRLFCRLFLELKREKRIPPPERPWEAGMGREWSQVLQEYNIPFKQSDLE